MFSFLKPRLSLRSLLPAGIDVHCHLLPGVDDGSECLEESLNIIRAQQALGLRGAIATPHIMARFPQNTPSHLRQVFQDFQNALSREFQHPKSNIQNPNFQLFLAAEYMLDDAFPRHLQSGDLLSIPHHLIAPPQPSTSNFQLSTSSKPFLLVELPQYLLPTGWQDMLDAVSAAGFTPLLAHPERYLRLMDETDIRLLTERGIALQGNLGSLNGLYGSRAQTLAKKLLALNLYSTWGSDAHSVGMLHHLNLVP